MRYQNLPYRSPFLLSLLLWACATMPDGGGGQDTPDGGGVSRPDGGNKIDPNAFWKNDPPLMMCVGGGAPMPPMSPPGGTPECPDDKNRQGCPCDKPGMTAPCWPGLRANRNLGICRDGTTTCKAEEVGAYWGPCQGYTLPKEGATAGADACQCFSTGRWEIKNISPCMIGGPPLNNCSGPNDCAVGQFCATDNKCRVAGAGGAVSTIVMGGNPVCKFQNGMVVQPTEPWSENTVKADCPGHFKLCYTLKAGNFDNPQPSDCTLAKVCTEGDLSQKDVAQPFGALPAWGATDAAGKACALQFETVGGYGEMSVEGKSITCDPLNARVFNRVKYCPGECAYRPQNPETREKCKNCGFGAGGTF